MDDQRDYLREAEAILASETMMIPQREHLHALATQRPGRGLVVRCRECNAAQPHDDETGSCVACGISINRLAGKAGKR